MGKIFRKSFDIDLENSLTYPSSSVICSSIEKNEKEVEFISKGNPIVFKIKEEIYEVEVKMAKGGYILHCRESKNS